MSDIDEERPADDERSGEQPATRTAVTPEPMAEVAETVTTTVPPSGRRRLVIAAVSTVAFLAIVAALGLLESLVAILIGVGGAAVYFVAANKLIDLLPEETAEKLRPWAFVGPVLVVLFGALVIPAVRSVWLSLFDQGGDFVFLDNYGDLFGDSDMRTVFRNNAFWLVGVTFFSTFFGLVMAVLADRIKRESIAKALVFLPMAISFVGASVIWRFVYAFKPADDEQIGILNAIWTGLGNDPVAWLIQTPWNNFLLIVVMIWLQTGFAMVVLSAAIKGVPSDLLEAARIDGANEWQVFRHVTLPSIAGTVAVVVTTTIILVLKVFDIVRVMTNGNFETNVIANEMVSQALQFGNHEVGAALAVILFVAVIPILVYNVRRFRREEAMR